VENGRTCDQNGENSGRAHREARPMRGLNPFALRRTDVFPPAFAGPKMMLKIQIETDRRKGGTVLVSR
jgi:hypothetical protein